MELAGDKPGVSVQLDRLYQLAILRTAGDHQAFGLKIFHVVVVHFPTVTVTLCGEGGVVEPGREAALVEHALLLTETHGTAEIVVFAAPVLAPAALLQAGARRAAITRAAEWTTALSGSAPILVVRRSARQDREEDVRHWGGFYVPEAVPWDALQEVRPEMADGDPMVARIHESWAAFLEKSTPNQRITEQAFLATRM